MSAIVDSSVAIVDFDGFVEESMMKRPMYTDQHHAEFAFHRFALLREKNILTDAVILSSDDKRFNVHSNIMAGKSDYFFSNLLNAAEHDTFSEFDAVSNLYRLKIDATTVEMIITFCYSGAVELTIDNVEDVLDGAKELQMESLTFLCEKMLEDNIDITNCVRFLEISEKHELNALKEIALTLIIDELPNIDRLPEFYHLNGFQLFWLITLLSNCQNGVFDGLIKSLNIAEHVFSSMNSFAGNETQSAVRAAFIAGYFQGSIINSPRLNSSVMRRSESTAILTDIESDSDTEELPKEQPPKSHVLCLLKRKSIEYSKFCDIEHKWEKSSKRLDLTNAIESYRDAVMVPNNKQITIFHMSNGKLQTQSFELDSAVIENVSMPDDVTCAGLALFCLLNDKIYCFARTDQQFFHMFDLTSKLWTTGQLDDVMDAKTIVGLEDELYFVGCGFDRTIVRSYHFGQKRWIPRGNLRYENKETCFKSAVVNGSIFIVMSCFDSAKIYNGTEFIVQRYDANVEDWIIIKKIYHSHFVDYFHLDAVDGCLYLYYGEGEVHIYNEESNEWRKGPTIDYNVLNVSMCMVAAKPEDKWMHQTRLD